ncbi:hypothetical protein [Herbidospora daliensis]|uniref:hypothetical protein n=1 Tax=Herbidospora daliensis TaxID=295585 RepID=UPI00078146FA|nr:hypothetical protein [Herbidospora daliensis]
MIDELAARYERYLQTDDPAELLDPSTAALVERIVASGRIDVHGLQLVVLVSWERMGLLREWDEEVIGLAVALHERHPEMLPPDLQAVCDARLAGRDPDDPADDPGYRRMYSTLHAALGSGDFEQMVYAATWFQARIVHTEPGSPLRPFLFFQLGLFFRSWALRSADPQPATSAIEMFAQIAPGHDLYADALEFGGGCHRVRFERTGAFEDLDRAVELTERALGHGQTWRRASGACMARRTRYELGRAPADREAALRHAATIARLAPRDRPEGLLALANAANVYGPGERGTTLLREVVERLDPGHDRWPFIVADLAADLTESDPAQARDLYATALERIPDDHPERGRILFNQALLAPAPPRTTEDLLERYAASGDPALLRQALAEARAELAGFPRANGAQVFTMLRLSMLLREAGGRDFDPAAIEEAVEMAADALARCERFPDALGDLLGLARMGLASCLAGRFPFRYDEASMNEAVRLLRLVDDDLARQALAGVLNDRAKGGRRPEDVAEALTLTGDPDLRARLLFTRFELAGDPGDLDDAIALARREAATLPGLSALSTMLRIRHVVRQDGPDLDAAVAAARDALEITVPEPEPADLANALGALSLALDLAGDPAGAAEAARKELAVVDGPVGRQHLGMALLSSFRASGEAADLDDAAATVREAIGLLPEVYATAHLYHSLLTSIEQERFARSGRPEHREAARAAVARALRSVPDADLMRSAVLLLHARLQDDPADAIAIYRECAALGTAPADNRVAAAWEWGSWRPPGATPRRRSPDTRRRWNCCRCCCGGAWREARRRICSPSGGAPPRWPPRGRWSWAAPNGRWSCWSSAGACCGGGCRRRVPTWARCARPIRSSPTGCSAPVSCSDPGRPPTVRRRRGGGRNWSSGPVRCRGWRTSCVRCRSRRRAWPPAGERSSTSTAPRRAPTR